MELCILNTDFEPIAVIDTFTSLIWTKRYFEPGEFELYVEATSNLMKYIQKDFYVVRDDDESVMIIEKIELQTDIENGNYLIISGKSLESLLGRRIIWPQTILQGTPSKVVMTLVENNISMNATEPFSNRAIPNFIVDYTNENLINEAYNYAFTGDNLLDAVKNLALRFGFGLKITLKDGQFIFSCYKRDKIDVTFSPEFDNLINSNYINDSNNYKNLAIIAGEGEGLSRTWCVADDWSNELSVPMLRREIFVDARDLIREGDTVDEIDYIYSLTERGKSALTEHLTVKIFEGQVEPNMTWTYKDDYDLGNIVSVENEYGLSSTARITEIIESWNENGYALIASFEEWEVK